MTTNDYPNHSFSFDTTKTRTVQMESFHNTFASLRCFDATKSKDNKKPSTFSTATTITLHALARRSHTTTRCFSCFGWKQLLTSGNTARKFLRQPPLLKLMPFPNRMVRMVRNMDGDFVTKMKHSSRLSAGPSLTTLFSWAYLGTRLGLNSVFFCWVLLCSRKLLLKFSDAWNNTVLWTLLQSLTIWKESTWRQSTSRRPWWGRTTKGRPWSCWAGWAGCCCWCCCYCRRMSPEPDTGALKNTDQLIQAYTSEYTGSYNQIQANTCKYDFQIRAHVTVCGAQIQANTGKNELPYQCMCACMKLHIFLYIQTNTGIYEKAISTYLYLYICIWHASTRHAGSYALLRERYMHV